MQVLYALESIRTPWLDTVMAAITHLGEETVFMVAALFVFWCVSKRHGYYLLAVGFAGTVLNQFLKLLFRIPRPWVLDSNFTIVESFKFFCKLCLFCKFYECIKHIIINSFCCIIVRKSLSHRNAVIFYTLCTVLA